MLKNFTDLKKEVDYYFNKLLEGVMDIMTTLPETDQEIKEKELYLFNQYLDKDETYLSLLYGKVDEFKEKFSDCYFGYTENGDVAVIDDNEELRGSEIASYMARILFICNYIKKDNDVDITKTPSFMAFDELLNNIISFVKNMLDFSDKKNYDITFDMNFVKLDSLSDNDLKVLFYYVSAIKYQINTLKSKQHSFLSDYDKLSDKDFFKKYGISRDVVYVYNSVFNNIEKELIDRTEKNNQRKKEK